MKMVQKPLLRQELFIKIALRTVAVSAFVLTIVFVATFNFSMSEHGMAATNGDYRSAATGNWNATGTWEKYDGTNCEAATSIPANSDSQINIQNGHTVTGTSGINVDHGIIDVITAIRVSPNPFNESFTAQFKLAETQEVLIQLISVNGTIVYSEKIMAYEGNNSYRFSAPAALKAGTYLIQVLNGKRVVLGNTKVIYRKDL
ncbi:MAG: T9SS type A sorting domain-containing protein [Bacteroidia bacterium]